MRQGIVVLAFALLLTGCGPTAEESAVSIVKAHISDGFKDPASTQFRNIKSFPKEDGRWVVCGEYNTKNGFGAYVGYAQFYGFTKGRGMEMKIDDLKELQSKYTPNHEICR